MQKIAKSDAGTSSPTPPQIEDKSHDEMMRQFREALNTLLFCLRNLSAQTKAFSGETATPNSMRELTEIALRETERVSYTVNRSERSIVTPARVTGALACETLESGRQSGNPGNRDASLLPAASSRQKVLSAREREVLALIIRGFSNKEGGCQLGISGRTFEIHRAHIMKKIGARNAADLVRLVISDAR